MSAINIYCRINKSGKGNTVRIPKVVAENLKDFEDKNVTITIRESTKEEIDSGIEVISEVDVADVVID